MHEARMERRTPTEVPARIAPRSQPSNVETVRLGNFSDRGARFVTPRPWQSGDWLILYSVNPSSCLAVGKVVYCQRLPEGHFAIGCEFKEGTRIQLPDCGAAASPPTKR